MDRAVGIRALDLRERRLSFFVGWLALTAAAGHALILGFAVLAGVRLLMFFNIASVALYGLLVLLNRAGMYSAVLITSMIEVLAHAVLATVLLGWHTSFHLYILCLIPLVFYVDHWHFWARAVAALATLAAYVGLAVFSDLTGATAPLRSVAPTLIQAARYGNMLIAAAIFIALSVFYQESVARAERFMQHYSSRLERLSTVDPLTGALNRRGTIVDLERTLAQGARDGTATAILLMDLDHFKRINDTWGHDTGDHMLVGVADACRGVLRSSDFFGRWGGEEFLAILSDTDTAGASLVAERIRRATAQVTVTTPDETDISTTVTIGLAVHTPGCCGSEDVDSYTGLVARADRALYDGKRDGRNRVSVAAESEAL